MSTNHTPGFLDAQRAVPNADGSPLVLRFGDGLDLWVTPRQKMWRCKVQRGGKRTTINLGCFPDVSIKVAKAKRAAMKVAADPAQAKRAEIVRAVEATATTFRLVATEWVETLAIKHRWTPHHRKLVEQRLALHVFRVWGDRPIAEITATEVRKLVGDLFSKGPAVAVAVKQYVSRVFDFAWSEDRVPFNPAKKVEVYLPTRRPGDEKPQAFVRTIEDARAVLAAVEARRKSASPWTLLAHRMIALTGTRKTEALAARWSEFDLDAAEWTVPAERMKGRYGARTAHVVALAPQAIEVLRAAKRIKTNEFVFATIGGKSGNRGEGRVSRCTVNKVMERALRLAGLGQIMVPHGWRGTFSTIMNEVDPTNFRIVDVMLAHKGFRESVDGEARKSGAESHYNHAEYRSARHAIACQWADMLLDGAPTALALIGLDAPAPATNVVPLRRAAA